MKRLYIITVLVALLSVSCNDWLDVKPETQTDEKDMFESVYESRDRLPSIRNNARCVADTVFAKETILDKYYRLFK